MRKFIYLLLVLMLVLPAIPTYAAGVTLAMDNSTDILTISAQTGKANKVVPVYVLKTGTDLSTITNSNFRDNILFAYIFTTDQNGDLTDVKIKISWADLQSYSVLIDNVNYSGNTFFYISPAQETLLILYIKGLTPEEVETSLVQGTPLYNGKTLNEYLQLDLTKYLSLTSKAAVNISVAGTSATNFNDFRTFFTNRVNEEWAMQTLIGKQSDEMGQFLRQTELFSPLNLDDKYGFAYVENIQDGTFENFCNSIKQSIGYQTFLTDFKKGVCLIVANHADWTEIEDVLIYYKDYLNLNLSVYDKLTKANKIAFAQQFAALIFSSITEIKSQFEKLTSEIYKLQETGLPRPSSSGGGGGYSPRQEEFTFTGKEEPSDQPKDVFFSDVTLDNWAYAYIKELYDDKIIEGYSENTFKPNEYITRAAFLKLLLTSTSLVTQNAECKFSDVSKGDWHYKFVSSAYSRGLILGYEDGSFGIDKPITRADMSVIVYRTLGLLGINTEKNELAFSDLSKIPSYATDAVSSLSSIIAGYPDNTFKPDDYLTRAEISCVVSKLRALVN